MTHLQGTKGEGQKDPQKTPYSGRYLNSYQPQTLIHFFTLNDVAYSQTRCWDDRLICLPFGLGFIPDNLMNTINLLGW